MMNQLKEFLSRALLITVLPAIAGASIFYCLTGKSPNYTDDDVNYHEIDLTDDDMDPRNK